MRRLLAPCLSPLVLSSAALAVAFWCLLDLDLPLVWFLRSVHVTWLEILGDVGNRLGSGSVLFAFSGVMLAVGLLSKWPAWRRAGLQGVIAHAAVGLIAQTIKRLVGRPRPRFTHGVSEFQFWPSLESGLDAFPSGHASASFAVAAVLAKHFPRARWIIYSAAFLVALSRVVRGSHFPTDVAVGAALGLLVGYVVANPIREWQASIRSALMHLTPYLVGTFALLWIVVHPPPGQLITTFMLSAGISALVIGIAIRVFNRLWAKGKLGVRGEGLGVSGENRTEARTSVLSARFAVQALGLPTGNVLIAVGLALTTGSGLVTTLVVFVCAAQSLAPGKTEVQLGEVRQATLDFKTMFSEAALVAGLVMAVATIQGLKGVIPIL
ncbi:phosphatase PAP2 family protein [Nitrospiraceae bacterium AH_259_D15_M11_P09]|nr:phosphatase PAP2 family protein [Nitrospiraceae bacterium AH_259_D15_M11_P09]